MLAPNDRPHRDDDNTAGKKRPSKPPCGNLILASVPASESKRLSPYLQTVPLKSGTILREANERGHFAYFPLRGLVSISVMMRDGQSIEIGTIGREGFVGVPLLLGGETASFRAAVQIEGEASRIGADRLQRLLPACPHLEGDLRFWLQAHICEIAQHAACNSLHPISQRLSRSLLLSYIRTGCDLLPMTHDTLAQMLGCRRSSVTAAARRLQRAHLIDYSRGRIRVLNAAALEQSACECYAAIQRYNLAKGD